jgi:predicted dinucleotide-binding enzyme
MSTISIFGAGNVARGIATRALAVGHDVQLLVRDLDKGTALASELDSSVTVSELSAAIDGAIVVLALPYLAVEEILAPISANFAGKVVIDATNPVNATFTGLAVSPGTSGAEAIAALLPGASVVKGFNLIFAGNVATGSKNGKVLDLLIAGDSAEAKFAVTAFGEETGFRVIDTGALSVAGVLESLAFLHIGLQFSRGTEFQSAIQIVD